MKNVSEKRDTLWILTYSPTIWAAHFLLCYLTAAIWCAKVAGPLGPLGGARTAMAVYTVLALVGIGLTWRRGYRRHKGGPPGSTYTLGYAHEPHGVDTPRDRYAFLGLATVLLSALSAVAVVYVALAAVFIGTCR